MDAVFRPFMPLDEHHAPEIDPAILFGPLRDMVLATAAATQTPPCFAAMLGLAAISAIAAKKFQVEIRPGWVEPLSLFTAVVAEPGSRKSAVVRLMTTPLHQLEKEHRERVSGEVATSAQHHKVLEEQVEDARKKLRSLRSSEEREVAHAELEAATENLNQHRIQPIPQLVTSDCTVERLGEIGHQQGGRIAVFSGEPTILSNVMGRYGDGRPNLELLLHGHSGEDVKIDRRCRGPIYIEKFVLNLAIGMQPEVLRTLNSSKEAVGRGLLARFFFVYSRVNFGSRPFRAPHVPTSTIEAYHDLITRLDALQTTKDCDGEILATSVLLSPKALKRLEEFYNSNEKEQAAGGNFEFMRAWASKLPGNVARFSLMLHLSRPEISAVEPISEQTMISAVSLGESLIPHARAAFAEVQTSAPDLVARKILSYVKRNKVLRFTKSDLYRALRRSNNIECPDSLDQGLQLLEEHGYARVDTSHRTKNAGRPPSPTYLVSDEAAVYLGVVRSASTNLVAI